MPWSYAATSKAQRVRVEAFSKIRQRFLPASLRSSVPAYLARFRSPERSRRNRISGRVKSDISRTLRLRRWTGMDQISPAAALSARRAIREKGHRGRGAGAVVEQDPIARETHFERLLGRQQIGLALGRRARGEI